MYPERAGKRVSEAWHGSKWNEELGPDQLTPMAIGHERQHFYVNELARTREGQFVIPLKWFILDGRLCCDSWRVTYMVCLLGYITNLNS